MQRLAEVEKVLPELLAELERLLPAWELDINRHMMLHLVEGIRKNGPCWTWSMFGFERLWNRLTQWMLQTTHPEATMMNAFKAFKTATRALPELFTDVLSDEVGQSYPATCSMPPSTPQEMLAHCMCQVLGLILYCLCAFSASCAIA